MLLVTWSSSMDEERVDSLAVAVFNQIFLMVYLSAG